MEHNWEEILKNEAWSFTTTGVFTDYIDYKKLGNYIANVEAMAESRVRAEAREKIEALIDANDDGMWSGRETAEKILALLSRTEE